MSFTVKLDNVVLANNPSHVLTVEPQPTATPTAGYGKIVYVPRIPGQVQLRWGDEAAIPAVVAELRTKRGSVPQHMLSWTKETGTGLYHRNVVMPLVAYGQGPGTAIDTFTLELEGYRPFPALAVWEFWVPGVIAVGDGKAKIKMPAGGRIMKVGGYIGTLGTGAGQTRVQVSNGATDYLSTSGDFVVASATGLMENAVLATSPTFNRGDTLELDVDTIPANSDSANLSVWLCAIMFTV
ncbi:MAG: hypothetical protein ABIH03_06220 [Pseudomonadota bacterium]